MNVHDGEFVDGGLAYLDESQAAALKHVTLHAGDVLLNITGASVARVCRLPDQLSGGRVNQHVSIIRPDKKRLDTNFLAHLLRAPEAKRRLLRVAGAGATREAITKAQIEEFKIPLPPLAEQRRIAAILDKADALRRKRKRSLDLLDSLTQSNFLEMFGDPVSNPKNFPLTSFGQIGTLDRGVSKHRPRNDPVLLGGSHPLIQTGDVANSGGYIRRYSSTYSDEGLRQSRKWPAGTLCITIAANIAQTGILTFPACFPDSVVGFQHERPAMVQFVRVWLMFLRATLERTAPTVAQKNINLQILRDLKIALPPSDTVSSFASRLNEQLKTEKQMQIGSIETETLFSSLQSRAFSGQL
jgi:type I restriction enzyme S subunit